MAKSISVKQKKRGRPATGSDPLVGVRLPKETIELLDAWGEERGQTRSEAIRDLIDRALKAHNAANRKKRK